MFNNSKVVIYFTNQQINIYLVKTGSNPSILKELKSTWTPETITTILSQGVKQFYIKQVQLLLGDNLMYIANVSIPAETFKKNGEQAIYEAAKKIIPDHFDQNQIQYKEITSKTADKTFQVSVPVMQYFQIISRALSENSIKVELISSEQESKKLNANPVIGILLTEKAKVISDSPLINNNPSNEINVKTSVRKGYLITLLTVLIIGVILIVGMLYYRNLTARTNEIVQVTNIPTQQPAPSPTVVQELKLSDYTVEVLNGSGIAGKAGEVADVLTQAGFENATTGNAENSDYENTVIQVKKSGTSSLLTKEILKLLQDYKLAPITELQSDSEFDLLIIVGKN